MPPKSKKPAAAPFPGRKAITRSVSGLTPVRLAYLAERRAARDAARGLAVNPDRLQGLILDELVHREYVAEQARERESAPDAGIPDAKSAR